MPHKTEVVNVKQLTDEAISIHIRCCDDPKSDSVLTVYGVANMTPEQMEAQVVAHHDRVAAKHQGMVSGKQHLEALVTRTKVHGEKK